MGLQGLSLAAPLSWDCASTCSLVPYLNRRAASKVVVLAAGSHSVTTNHHSTYMHSSSPLSPALSNCSSIFVSIDEHFMKMSYKWYINLRDILGVVSLL